jgi:Protein of unknown function (DUF3072)
MAHVSASPTAPGTVHVRGHHHDQPQDRDESFQYRRQHGQGPEDWTTGEEPMTGAQRSYLKTLREEADEPMD